MKSLSDKKQIRFFVIRSAVFLAIFYFLNLLAGLCLAFPKKALIEKGFFYPERRWRDFYAQPKDSIDLVFLGSSHCYRGFDPAIFNASSGLSAFNMGSSEQSPVTSYFVLKEVLKTQKPKMIVIETFWRIFYTDSQFANASYNYEFIKSDDVKREFLANGYAPEDWINFMLPSYRYRNNYESLIRYLLDRQVDTPDFEYYKTKGYVENPRVVAQSQLIKGNIFKTKDDLKEQIKLKNIEYLNKTIELAEANGITVVFVTAPIPPISLDLVDNYGEIHRFTSQLAQGMGIEFIDYNLINTQENLFMDHDFFDSHHLNKQGVVKLSEDLAKRLLGKE